VRNATRYTAEGTTVEVQLERQPADGKEQMIVRVLDSGPGVPEEALQKIFEPFYRLDDARNRDTGGAGWASPSRIAPSGCTAGNFVHPTAKKVG